MAVLTLGLPAWWVLGVNAFLPLAIAAGMAWHLARSNTSVHLPAGSAWLLLFLVWVVLGAGTLWSDAPGAVPGGDGPGRLLVFGYRFAWYVACAVVLVWVANTSRTRVPDRQVHGLIAFLFVLATAGGLLGMLAPQLEFRSVLETLLPGGLRSNAFVSSLVHVEVADIQYVLGHPSPRPKAPFAFTNTWGSVIALSLPFLAAFAIRSGTRWRIASLGVVAVALVPIAFSLNRGLWTCLAVGAVGALVLVMIRSRVERTALLLAAAGAAAAILVASPLGQMVGERLDNPHSNDRREQLLGATVDSVSEGSPVVGFGTTRDVQGSFATIAGGATPDCPACGVPPLGTQGHLWLVLFSQGWIGLALLGLFLVPALIRCLRMRTPNEVLAVFVVGFFLIQVLVYDTLGLPLLIVMVAIGLVARERRESTRTPTWTAAQLAARVRTGIPIACILVLLGASAGWFATPGRDEPSYVSEARIALTPPPAHLAASLYAPWAGGRGPDRSATATIDTEAALLSSDRTLQRALDRRGLEGSSTAELRHTLQVGAEATTDVLVLSATAHSKEAARTRVQDVAQAYIATRQEQLERRRTALLEALRSQRGDLASSPGAEYAVERLDVAIHRLLRERETVGRVVKLAPAEKQEPDVAVTMVSGAGLGLLVAVGIAAIRRRLG